MDKNEKVLAREAKAQELLGVADKRSKKEASASIKFRMAGLQAVKDFNKFRNMQPMRGDRGLGAKEILR